MVRYFCDRCGEERSELHPVKINSPWLYFKPYELCDKCIDRLKSWFESEEKEEVDEK